MQPIVAGAGQAASALGVVPGVGTIAAGAAPLLSAVSKLQVGSVPQAVKGFDWYVEKVTVPPSAHHGVMQGVVWAIPKDMFALLGGRLTGSLALSFIPAASVGQAAWAARPRRRLRRRPDLLDACPEQVHRAAAVAPDPGGGGLGAAPFDLSATPATGSRSCRLRHRHRLLVSLA
jgi:hypothetical protein